MGKIKEKMKQWVCCDYVEQIREIEEVVHVSQTIILGIEDERKKNDVFLVTWFCGLLKKQVYGTRGGVYY